MTFNSIRKAVRECSPLVHCITNPISINQCANALLAAGARPIMAEHPDETAEITKTAKALVLNLGNITDARIQSIKLSAQTAKDNDIPFVLDLVGIACSKLRRDLAYSVIQNSCPAVVKGNYSEINALYNSEYTSSGVDSENLDVKRIADAAVRLAKKYNTIILASGKTDIVTDGNKVTYIKNGTVKLSSVTGTGCMLGALCGCYLAVSADISAVITACAVLGICGELSENTEGNGSFMIKLMDNLSILSDADFEKYLKTEDAEIENI